MPMKLNTRGVAGIGKRRNNGVTEWASRTWKHWQVGIFKGPTKFFWYSVIYLQLKVLSASLLAALEASLDIAKSESVVMPVQIWILHPQRWIEASSLLFLEVWMRVHTSEHLQVVLDNFIICCHNQDAENLTRSQTNKFHIVSFYCI